ncbi:MAG: ABC transporter ATP-binding protein [Clostridiales Family XIII bacterium]|jgi:iron complex transport system ATP-binding protein|nr:ABC transporter ATP-binding protein [Clostridiales Family XIII bacterium]
MLEIRNLICGYAGAVIEGFSVDVAPGEALCILGRNGIGKTTLFRTLLGTLPPLSGEVLFGGADLFSMPRREKAEKLAYVPQSHNPPFAYTALDIVLMGRAGLMSAFSLPSARDREMARSAMETLGISDLEGRAYTKVSGGERQMILIARALAQGADFLFLDEPAANLDYGNQMRVLRVMRDLAASGKGIVFTSHDPGHALLLGAKAAAIHAKDGFRIGAADDVVTKEMAGELYGVRAEVVEVFDAERGGHVKVFAPFLD